MKKQSQIFNPGRFVNCLKRELALNGRTLLLKWLLMIAGLTCVLYALNSHETKSVWYETTQVADCYGAFCIGALFILTIGASFFMKNMTNKGLCLDTLMSPTSTLEKYLSHWLIYVLAWTIMFLSSFAIAEGLRVLIIMVYGGNTPYLHYIAISEFSSYDSDFYKFIIMLLAAQATFVLGSTVAPKNAFLKTAGVIAVLLVAFFVAVSNTFLTLNPYGIVPPETEDIVEKAIIIVPVCWTIFCYITAYFRLKESEIIERL